MTREQQCNVARPYRPVSCLRMFLVLLASAGLVLQPTAAARAEPLTLAAAGAFAFQVIVPMVAKMVETKVKVDIIKAAVDEGIKAANKAVEDRINQANGVLKDRIDQLGREARSVLDEGAKKLKEIVDETIEKTKDAAQQVIRETFDRLAKQQEAFFLNVDRAQIRFFSRADRLLQRGERVALNLLDEAALRLTAIELGGFNANPNPYRGLPPIYKVYGVTQAYAPGGPYRFILFGSDFAAGKPGTVTLSDNGKAVAKVTTESVSGMANAASVSFDSAIEGCFLPDRQKSVTLKTDKGGEAVVTLAAKLPVRYRLIVDGKPFNQLPSSPRLLQRERELIAGRDLKPSEWDIAVQLGRFVEHLSSRLPVGESVFELPDPKSVYKLELEWPNGHKELFTPSDEYGDDATALMFGSKLVVNISPSLAEIAFRR